MDLLVYLFAIALVLMAPFVVSFLLDGTHRLSVPPVPEAPDPQKTAFLRGGDEEATRLVLFDLVRRGHLVIQGDERGRRRLIARAAEPPEGDSLTDLESQLVDCFSSPRTFAEVYRFDFPRIMRGSFEPIRDELTKERMLIPQSVRSTGVGLDYALSITGFVLAFLLGYDYFDSFWWGAAGAALFVFARRLANRLPGNANRRHLTRLGRRYLSAMEDAFADRRDRNAKGSGRPEQYDYLMTVALFGTVILQDTPFDAFHHMSAGDYGGYAGGGYEGGYADGGMGGGAGCGGGCGGG